jgi:hypothetical protein
MPGFRARYQLSIDYIDSAGLGMAATDTPGVSFGASQGQTLVFFNTICPGSQTFVTADINSILSQMQTDLATQLTANQSRIQAFTSGGG